MRVAGRDHRAEPELLHHYAVGHLLRRLRRRTSGAETTYSQLAGARRHVKAAITLLDWLATRIQALHRLDGCPTAANPRG